MRRRKVARATSKWSRSLNAVSKRQSLMENSSKCRRWCLNRLKNCLASAFITGVVVGSLAFGSDLNVVSDRHRRAISGRKRACEILFAIDEPLWNHKDQNMSSLVEMAGHMVDDLNDIFSHQIFEGSFSDIYFRLSRVQVVFGSCVGPGFKNCTEQSGLFLRSFNKPRNFSDFCLAYLFTFRDFRNGTAGLAGVGSACDERDNSGFVTMLNYGEERSLDESVITFAHEVAHNFNATHDNDWEERRPECAKGNYIMSDSFDFVTTSYVSANPQFSPCSVDSMKSMLKEIADKKPDCFNPPEEEPGLVEVALCGNGIVEPGEECDCGKDEFDCYDPCCYPAKILKYDKETYPNAVSCTVHTKPSCLSPPPLIFGIYLPLVAVLLGSVIVTVFLRRDWKADKFLFRHVTEGNVRIVNRPQNTPCPPVVNRF